MFLGREPAFERLVIGVVNVPGWIQCQVEDRRMCATKVHADVAWPLGRDRKWVDQMPALFDVVVGVILIDEA